MDVAYEWLMSLLHKPIGQFTLIDIGAVLLLYAAAAVLLAAVMMALKKKQ